MVAIYYRIVRLLVFISYVQHQNARNKQFKSTRKQFPFHVSATYCDPHIRTTTIYIILTIFNQVPSLVRNYAVLMLNSYRRSAEVSCFQLHGYAFPQNVSQVFTRRHGQEPPTLAHSPAPLPRHQISLN